MTEPLFIPTSDKVHFPLLSKGSDEIFRSLMGADHLEFFAPRKLELCYSLFKKPGANWHLYGDTRWPAESAWVEFPLNSHGISASCGVLVLRGTIPEDEDRPFAWAAVNGPLATIFREERAAGLLDTKIRMLESAAASTAVVDGPDDDTPRFVQSYCIFRDQKGAAELVNVYTDFLNAEGIPIPKFRSARGSEEINFCHFALHSLFTLNGARLHGMDLIHARQFPEFGPVLLREGDVGPRWAKFHPCRALRTRPAVRNLPNPTDNKFSFLRFDSMQKIMETRRREWCAEMLAFEREVRPHVMPHEDGNAMLGAFTHRMNGGAIYVLPDGLVEEFDNTDCSEVHIGDIKLPFPNVFLKFSPPKQTLLADVGPVDGCYAVWQQEEILLVLTSCMPGVDYERSLSVTCTDPMFSIHLPANNKDMPINEAVELGIQEFLNTNAPPTDNLSQDVTHPDGTTTHFEDIRRRSREKRIETFRSQEPAFRECLNIIINAACFISFKPEDITEEWEGEPPTDLLAAANLPGKNNTGRIKQMDAKRGIANGDFTRIKLCGKALFPDDSGLPGHGKSPRAHWRRGHWRRQRHGPGLLLIALRWIRPTLVKKESGEPVEARVYDVQNPADPPNTSAP
jgi:hypothetical protein